MDITEALRRIQEAAKGRQFRDPDTKAHYPATEVAISAHLERDGRIRFLTWFRHSYAASSRHIAAASLPELVEKAIAAAQAMPLAYTADDVARTLGVEPARQVAAE